MPDTVSLFSFVNRKMLPIRGVEAPDYFANKTIEVTIEPPGKIRVVAVYDSAVVCDTESDVFHNPSVPKDARARARHMTAPGFVHVAVVFRKNKVVDFYVDGKKYTGICDDVFSFRSRNVTGVEDGFVDTLVVGGFPARSERGNFIIRDAATMEIDSIAIHQRALTDSELFTMSNQPPCVPGFHGDGYAVFKDGPGGKLLFDSISKCNADLDTVHSVSFRYAKAYGGGEPLNLKTGSGPSTPVHFGDFKEASEVQSKYADLELSYDEEGGVGSAWSYTKPAVVSIPSDGGLTVELSQSARASKSSLGPAVDALIVTEGAARFPSWFLTRHADGSGGMREAFTSALAASPDEACVTQGMEFKNTGTGDDEFSLSHAMRCLDRKRGGVASPQKVYGIMSSTIIEFYSSVTTIWEFKVDLGDASFLLSSEFEIVHTSTGTVSLHVTDVLGSLDANPDILKVKLASGYHRLQLHTAFAELQDSVKPSISYKLTDPCPMDVFLPFTEEGAVDDVEIKCAGFAPQEKEVQAVKSAFDDQFMDLMTNTGGEIGPFFSLNAKIGAMDLLSAEKLGDAMNANAIAFAGMWELLGQAITFHFFLIPGPGGGLSASLGYKQVPLDLKQCFFFVAAVVIIVASIVLAIVTCGWYLLLLLLIPPLIAMWMVLMFFQNAMEKWLTDRLPQGSIWVHMFNPEAFFEELITRSFKEQFPNVNPSTFEIALFELTGTYDVTPIDFAKKDEEDPLVQKTATWELSLQPYVITNIFNLIEKGLGLMVQMGMTMAVDSFQLMDAMVQGFFWLMDIVKKGLKFVEEEICTMPLVN